MPRITILTNLSEKEAHVAAEKAAEKQQYEITDGDDGEMRARKGSLTASILLGAFILYANFGVFLEQTKKGDTRLILEWETPWWTGFIGAGRTRSAAKSYADEIEYRIEKAGGEVFDRKDS